MNDMMKIITSLGDSNILIDGITEAVKRNKNRRRWICSCFVSTFSHFISATSDFFSSKRYKWKMSQKSSKRIYEKTFFALIHPLNNIEITTYFNHEPSFNGVFFRK